MSIELKIASSSELIAHEFVLEIRELANTICQIKQEVAQKKLTKLANNMELLLIANEEADTPRAKGNVIYEK